MSAVPIARVLIGLAALICLVLACNDQVIQTAERLSADPADSGTTAPQDGGPPASGDSSEALDCLSTQADPELPNAAGLPEATDPEAWPLVGQSYGPLEGPGVYVTARDTFRVYANGHLVGESDQPRTPVFIPLSLLPGENVIAVSVRATRGTPAALVQVDDLSGSFTSNADWKVATSPVGDWTSTQYDDADWPQAAELVAQGSLPGCDPDTRFPQNSSASWIGSGSTEESIALRRTISIQAQGFASGSTGGGSSAVQLARTWEELQTAARSDEPATILLPEGTYDFRRQEDKIEIVDACPQTCADDPTVTTLTGATTDCSEALVSYERTERKLEVTSNKTIVGLGRGAALRGVSFELADSENVILRNIAVSDVNRQILEARDGLLLRGASKVWVDHASLKWISDGFAELIDGTTDVTFSNVLFDGDTQAECKGRERWGATFVDASVTVHHSRFDQMSTRAPRAEGAAARLHLFNDVFTNISDGAVDANCEAEVLMEGSVFENVEAATRLSGCDGGERGLLLSRSNTFRDGTTFVGGNGEEPADEVFSPPYGYTLDDPMTAWSRVTLRAGMGGPWARPLTVE